DLLGLARLEANPTRAPTDLATIAGPLVEDAHERAPRATITFSADNDTTVRGDPDALERVLRNLIDNALAAIQPTGRIDVQLRRRDGFIQAREIGRHTSELQSPYDLVCRLLLEKKKLNNLLMFK